MKDGFFKIAAATPEITVADPLSNAAKIGTLIHKAESEGVTVVALPELAITAYTCGDLFFQHTLLDGAETALRSLLRATADCEVVAAIGLPLRVSGKLYNCAAVMTKGKLLGIVPKSYLPDYSEFNESRYFMKAPDELMEIQVAGLDYKVPFGSAQLFRCEQFPDLCIGVEICEDLWVPLPPAAALAMAGANLILNLSASPEMVGKAAFRKNLVQSQSARYICAYVYADAGFGESSTDLVFSAHNIIAENGKVLAESPRFQNGMIITEMDAQLLLRERARRVGSFPIQEIMKETLFSVTPKETTLARKFSPTPYIPHDKEVLSEAVEDIFTIQANGLAKRMQHTRTRKAIIGLSGGLDSTMALLATARAFDLLHLDKSGIYAITMPCFGTTERTKGNAWKLAEAVGASIEEINIADAVRAHFADLKHDENNHNVVFENAQARERTQLLMDLANAREALVVGTGDLSELALGFATFNGDHMSNYGVNASVPKTLMRYMVKHVAETCGNEQLKQVLIDILETPVSPELLPPDGTQILQKTEEIIGDYRLHDFFLYYMLRYGYGARKLYRVAKLAFAEEYAPSEIKKWQMLFYRRFFAHQFKRSCMPDGPKVGSVGLSPRGDFHMPSDAVADLWLAELAACED